MSEKHVVVWQDGLIELTEAEPEGGISIAHGEEKLLEDALASTARLAYDGEHWIAPEVRGAYLGDGRDPVKALQIYQDRFLSAFNRLKRTK